MLLGVGLWVGGCSDNSGGDVDAGTTDAKVDSKTDAGDGSADHMGVAGMSGTGGKGTGGTMGMGGATGTGV